jgi:hypothetical protein
MGDLAETGRAIIYDIFDKLNNILRSKNEYESSKRGWDA